MAKNTNKPKLAAAEKNQPSVLSNQPASALNTASSKPIIETANMEVHHHSHSSHGKRNWKSYAWEFIMLFLAVFCGYLAEYQLEHAIERDREKQFVKSMIEDAQTDTANIHKAIVQNKIRVNSMNSLAQLCFNYDVSAQNDTIIYRLYRAALIRPDVVSATERTLLQLKNSGGMRLIRKKTAIDEIMRYDDAAKKSDEQKGYYSDYQKELGNSAFELFNFQYFQSDSLLIADAAQLISHDRAKLIAFANRVRLYGGIVSYYIVRLQEMDKNAISLINTLRKEYDME